MPIKHDKYIVSRYIKFFKIYISPPLWKRAQKKCRYYEMTKMPNHLKRYHNISPTPTICLLSLKPFCYTSISPLSALEAAKVHSAGKIISHILLRLN